MSEAKEPARLILHCRILPRRLSDDRPWPWIQRKKQLFKSLLRGWGLVIEWHDEEFTNGNQDEKEGAEADSATQGKADHAAGDGAEPQRRD